MKRNFCIYISNLKIFFVFTVIFFAVIACNSSDEKKLPDKNSTSVDTTFMNVSETDIPEAQGADVFRANCVTCHSARYIQMQPDFPRTTWEKITDKMIKTYGAPISDSAEKTIVDYLVAIKGKK